jgi:CRISPR system Cascade subunit CasD
MADALLLLRLEGVLQSWGTRSRWDVRDSADEPTKSGLIGLLGCAFGYARLDPKLEELDKSLKLGLRVENFGYGMTDFQTITGQLPTASGGTKGNTDDPATIISPRTYLQDAAFLAVLGGERTMLERCRAALLSPKWPYYLGRKSCSPSRPVFEALTEEYESIEDTLRKHPWDWECKDTISERPRRLRCCLEDQEGDLLRPDQLPLNATRMFGLRRVRVFWIDFPGEKEVSECISHG